MRAERLENCPVIEALPASCLRIHSNSACYPAAHWYKDCRAQERP